MLVTYYRKGETKPYTGGRTKAEILNYLKDPDAFQPETAKGWEMNVTSRFDHLDESNFT